MPILFIEGPTGIHQRAKTALISKATDALRSTYSIPDVRIFFRWYSPDNISQDGSQHTELLRPVCFLHVPQLRNTEAKRKLAVKLNDAVAEAFQQQANTEEIMTFFNEYPIEQVAWAGRLQSDNPEVVSAVAVLNGNVKA